MFSGSLSFANYIALVIHVHIHIHVFVVLFSVYCCNAAAAPRYNNPNQQQLDKNSNSCGDIQNISSPFRLKADPHDNGGNKYIELECENNRTILYLNSGKYYVQAINYTIHTIRLVDVGIQRNNCFSLPLYSLTNGNFTSPQGPYFIYSAQFAVFVSCEKPVNSLLYIDTTSTNTSCENGGGGGGKSISSSFSSKKHSYVLVGTVSWSDVANLCSVDMIFPTRPISVPNISSFLDVHNVLADGFDLFWDLRRCNKFSCGVLILLGTLFNFFCWAVLSIKILFALCAFAFLIHKFRRRHLSMFDNIEGYLRSQNHLVPINYSYSKIKKMTIGFKDKLGERGYGSVYKGKLRSGHLVAIKVLGKAKANGQEFINEVATIGRIHHVNVVQLVGSCAERSKRALVYDFMPNGSLEKYIFTNKGDILLSCKQMYEISLGVAHGIEYLHQGCDMQILHFDIKPHNILLDENFTPKVSDFGLAKLYPTDDSIVTLTAARGTMGYMAPELFYKNIGGISHKADVYSFGMLLMEMAGKRKNLNAFAEHTSQIYFPSWIYDQFKEGKDVEMGETSEEERVMVKKMVIVALWCIQMKPCDRPSMNKVVEMLEGNVEQLQMPPKPFLCPQEMPGEDHRININPTNLPIL